VASNDDRTAAKKRFAYENCSSLKNRRPAPYNSRWRALSLSLVHMRRRNYVAKVVGVSSAHQTKDLQWPRVTCKILKGNLARGAGWRSSANAALFGLPSGLLLKAPGVQSMGPASMRVKGSVVLCTGVTRADHLEYSLPITPSRVIRLG
jgi:hypothetical protein